MIRPFRRSEPARNATADAAPGAAPSDTGSTPPTTGPDTSGATSPAVGVSRFEVWGTSVTLCVQPPQRLDAAVGLLRQQIATVDQACSRFRPDSEIEKLNQARGRPVKVSQTLLDAVEAALRVAALTDGAVDPTVGGALRALGYDRDYAEVTRLDPSTPLPGTPAPAMGWHWVRVDRRARTIQLPPETMLDLGATAKAWCVDRAVQRIVSATGASVLLSMGGDVAVAGPPPTDGWSVAVVEDTRAADPTPLQVVAIRDGALASSATVGRTWRRAGWPLHHIVDPRTGWPAEAVWRLVTVAAASCLDANAASTAAVVWGEAAPARLQLIGLPARLAHRDGTLVTVAGWPRDSLPLPGQPRGPSRNVS